MSRAWKVTTTINGSTYHLTIRNAPTLNDCLNGVREFFDEEYDLDAFALPIPIDIKLVTVND